MRYAALGAAFCVFVFAAEDKLLFDFRAPQGNPAPALSPEARRNLLSAVFPRYLGSETECKVDLPPTEAALEAARSSGQFVPELVSRAAGSFTRTGARQMVYLIKVGECSAPARSYFGTYRLAVFENGRLIAAPEARGDNIALASDVDGDGIDEILVPGCGFSMGSVECSATLLSIAGGTLGTVRTFPEVYRDGCGYSREAGISATVIRYSPGRPPQFFEHEYEAACPAPGQTPEFRPAPGRKF